MSDEIEVSDKPKAATALEWHTEQRIVRDLVPYEYNPRMLTNDQHEQLTASLKKFGLVELPAINTDGKLVAGHQRTKIMIELGKADEEIDVRVPNRPLTEEEFREYLIRSNKNTGGWDFDVLANSFEVDELHDWGFSDQDLGLSMGGDDAGTDDDDADGGPKIHTCPSCSFQFEG